MIIKKIRKFSKNWHYLVDSASKREYNMLAFKKCREVKYEK